MENRVQDGTLRRRLSGLDSEFYTGFSGSFVCMWLHRGQPADFALAQTPVSFFRYYEEVSAARNRVPGRNRGSGFPKPRKGFTISSIATRCNRTPHTAGQWHRVGFKNGDVLS